MEQVPHIFAIAEKPSQLREYLAALPHRWQEENGVRYGYVPPGTFDSSMLIFAAEGHLMQLKYPQEYEGKEHLAEWNIDSVPFGLPLKLEYRPSTPTKYVNGKSVLVKKDANRLLGILETIKQHIRRAISTYGADNVTIIHSADCDFEGSAITHLILRYCITEDEYQQINHNRLWINSLEPASVREGFSSLAKNPTQAKADGLMDINRANSAILRAHNDYICGLSCTRINTILLNKFANYTYSVLNKSGNAPNLDLLLGKNKVYNTGRIISCLTHMVYSRTVEIENFVPTPFYEVFGNFTARNGQYKGKAKFKSFSKLESDQFLSSFGLTDGAPVQGQITNIEVKEVHSDSPKLHSLTTLQIFGNSKYQMNAKAVLDIAQRLYEKKLTSYPRSSINVITNLEYDYLYTNLEKYKAVFNMPFETAYHKPRKRYVDSSSVQEHHALIVTKTIPTIDKINSLSKDERLIYDEIVRTTLAMFAPNYVYEKTTITTNVKGLNFTTTGKVEKDRGFKALWGDDELALKTRIPSKKDKDEDENSMDQSLPSVTQDETVRAIVNEKVGETAPPNPFTEGTLLQAMETCGKEVEDEEEAQILKEIGGIGTAATRADAINKIKTCEYVSIIKNKLVVTPKGRIKSMFVEGTMFSDIATTAKWEKYLRGVAEGRLSEEPFKERTNQFVSDYKSKSLAKLNDDLFFENVMKLLSDSNEGYEKTRVICPGCKDGDIAIVEGSTNKFFACSNYRREQDPCKFTLPTTYAGKKLSAANIKQLCVKRKTSALEFTSKKETKYKAYLLLDDSLKIKMEYVQAKLQSK